MVDKKVLGCRAPRSPLINPAGRKTRSSTEKEERRKQSEAKERERAEAEAECAREQQEQKVRKGRSKGSSSRYGSAAYKADQTKSEKDAESRR